jgi:DNA polymerase I
MAAKPPPKLFLVDAMGFIFRAYFAPMERLRSPSGIPTKVPYLFSNMLRRLKREFQPDYLAVVFDRSEPTFRDKLFAQYKEQRPPMPADLSVQLPYVRRLCQALRLPVLELSGYEADDIIGTLAQQASKRKVDIYIVTSDKDLLQLVGGAVRVLIPTKQDLIVDEAKVEELLGVPPAKVTDLMALMGDSIDNIPGAKGIGEKGARDLIQRFGSVERALQEGEKVENKRYREALLGQQQQILMSKQLATVSTDAPVQLELEKLTLREPDHQALRALYAELGFTSLLKELAPATSPLAEGRDYTALQGAAAVREFLDTVPRQQEIAFWLTLAPSDAEGEGFGSRIAAIEFSPQAGVARTVTFPPHEAEQIEILEALRPWLADAARPKIVHDPKLVEVLLGPVRGIRHATMLYSYLLLPTTANHEHSEVVLRWLNATLSGAPGERADALQRIAPLLRQKIEEQKLGQVYEELDLPLAAVLAAMEGCGVRVDPAALAEMSAAMETEVRSLERTIWELAGTEFNINSPAQLAEILFDKMNLPPPARRSGKARSTAADILESMALVHELPRKVLEYREISKLKGTYVDALPKLIYQETGRLHTRFSQTGTATGRLSSSSPNLQNIPVRTDLGRQIRAAFAAAPGRALLSADYSQIELRLLAHFSQDPVLVEAFRRGEDIHARTAQEVFAVGPLLQSGEHRRVAKIINFGIVYGLSPFGLAQQLGIEPAEARQFIDAYFAKYRGVKEYLARSLAQTRQTGFTKTLFGRVRPIPEINAPQANLRNMAERTALNTPLQGTAADLIKLAMIEISRRLGAEKFSASMILQVHDELLFEAPPEELAALRAMVKQAMEQVHPLLVPLVAETKWGANWRDMQPLKN